MTDERSARVLVVDDEDGVRSFLAEALERSGHDVVMADNGAVGLRLAREQPFDLVLTDLRMPELDGMGLVRALRKEQPDLEVIILTAFGDVGSAVEAMKLGAFDYLEKPVSSPAALRELCSRALTRRRELLSPTRGAALPPTGQKALVSTAPAMAAVVDAIAKVSKTSATVLLAGESGTGKEVTARAIHDLGPRAGGPFVAINCAVLTENLLESELFGHEKGAFTGAHTQRRGRLELADGGTFFLDEVAELQPGLQAKLLRALEERQFERLGGARPINIDVRWIAATHRDLRRMVAAGTFRDDLYHRLAVFPIRLPPLRERREDIVPLAEHLLRTLSGGRPARLTADVQRVLEARSWPGNIRELKNALERALILADGGALSPELFAAEDDSPEAAPQSLPAASLEELEKQAIVRALAGAGGNRKAAAERLGIGLRTLYEKLKRYGIR